MSQDLMQSRIARLTAELAGRPLDGALDAWLNEHHGAASATFAELAESIRSGVAEGWLCNRQSPGDSGGIRYGRIFKPSEALAGFSVDVVDMADLAGPHHAHPNGEIDLIVPVDADATFDGRGAGWLVYPPGSAHRPTVRGGRAYVLYLLPAGAIDFTKG
ncbi:MAG TPA: DUF4863 family protein [Burkholderiaceae bacterium]|nr:DUF4863 family protein [Burkholderiaceae bacterium]HMZ02879.1 DUF4863 family protein [Burkholderiaceae bacterium]HNB45115.1 DUF4863 family protein [Burkholderiaceae bacterium]